MERKKASKKRRGGASSRTAVRSTAYACAFGAGVGGIFAVALLIIFSVTCMFSENPDALISPFAVCTALISFFAAGFAAAKKRHAALPCGALAGAVLALGLFTVSLFLSRELSAGLSVPITLLIWLSFILISVIGALLGANSGSGKRRKGKK